MAKDSNPFSEGLSLDARPVNINGWADARNILITKGFNSFANEEGVELQTQVDNDIIGIISTGRELVIFSTDGIGLEIDRHTLGGSPTKILNTSEIIFTKNNPIEGVFKYNYKNELIIAWCDGTQATSNAPMTLNLDTATDFLGLDGVQEFIDSADINKLRLFPETNNHTIDGIFADGSGNLSTGTYTFTFAYYTDNNELLDYQHVSGPAHVYHLKGTNLDIMGTEGGENPNYHFQVGDIGETVSIGILLKIKDIDQRFNKFRIAVIRNINGVVDAHVIGDYNITGTTYNIGYSGSHIESTTLDEVTEITTKVEKAETITISKSRLAIADFETLLESINLQKYINNIKVKYVLRSVALRTYNDDGDVTSTLFNLQNDSPTSLNGNNVLSEEYTIDEGLSLGDLIDTGTEIKYGAVVLGSDPVFTVRRTAAIVYITSNPTYYTQIRTTLSLRWGGFKELLGGIQKTYMPDEQYKLYCHAHLTNGLITPGFLIPANNNTVGSNYLVKSDTSAGEVFPNTEDALIYNAGGQIGDLRNQTVQYHEIPSTIALYSGLNSANDTNLIDKVIGLTFEDIYIPPQFRDVITHLSFSYAKRTNPRKLSSGIIMDINSMDNAVTTPANERFRERDIADRDSTWDANAPYIEYFDPYILSNNLKIPNGATLITKGRLIGANLSIPHTLHRIDRTQPDYTYTDTIINNIPWKDDTSGSGVSYHNYLRIKSKGIGKKVGLEPRGFYYLADIFSNNPDKSPFYNQTLVNPSIHKYDPLITTVEDVYNGDSLLTSNTIALWAKNDSSGLTTKSIIHYPTYAPSNNFAMIITGAEDLENEADLTLTGQSTRGFFNHKKFFESGGYRIDKYVNWVNEYKVIRPYNPYNAISDTTKYPFRTIRAIPPNPESVLTRWNKFLEGDYYEATANKGRIIRILGTNKTLLIQHEYSLFDASIKEQIGTLEDKAYYAEGDIFDRTPDEKISTNEGYTGCQSHFGNVLSKAGYFSIDKDTGKIFLFKGQGNVLEISKSNTRYFENNLGGITGLDNPFLDNGYTCGYDSKNERFLFTKKGVSDTVSLTMSYSIERGVWVCFHDYYPNYYFNHKKQLFGVVGNKIYQHGVKPNSIIYDGSSVNSYIDMVFGGSKLEQVGHLYNVALRTDVISSGIIKYDKTATHIMIYNKDQCSDLINLKDNRFINSRNLQNNEWFINEFRDLIKDRNLAFLDNNNQIISSNIDVNKSWFKKVRFIGNYVIVRVLYDNLEANEFFINSIDINKENSIR